MATLGEFDAGLDEGGPAEHLFGVAGQRPVPSRVTQPHRRGRVARVVLQRREDEPAFRNVRISISCSEFSQTNLLIRLGQSLRFFAAAQAGEQVGVLEVGDVLVQYRPTDIAADELGAIRADVKLIYADDATDAGADDGHWYRDRIPSSTVVRVSSGGALALVTQWSRILEHVAPDHGGLPEVAREGEPQERVDRRG